MNIKLSGITKESLVDGPGIRYVIFSQGCNHKCRGCHNPSTHDFNGGQVFDADEVIKEILSSEHIDGVTFSGGDPFYQPEEFSYIAKILSNKNINIMSYTGFTFEEIVNNKKTKELLDYIDILIDGPFMEEKRTLKIPFRGSENQRAIDVKKSLKEEKLITIDF